MGNSFYISLKPDLAAAVVKIDAIKNDTGPIRNDVTAIHDTNLPAVKNDTGPIRNDVTAIHDTMLPSVKVDTGAIRNDVTDIHDTNLPLVKVDTGAIRNDVDDLKTAAASIKLKTDAMPQNVRGRFYGAFITTASGTYVDIVSVTGQGRFYSAIIKLSNLNDTVQIAITIDGKLMNVNHTGDVDSQSIVCYGSPIAANGLYANKTPSIITNNTELWHIDFAVSLLIQVKRSAGAADNVHAGCSYAVDDF